MTELTALDRTTYQDKSSFVAYINRSFKPCFIGLISYTKKSLQHAEFGNAIVGLDLLKTQCFILQEAKKHFCKDSEDTKDIKAEFIDFLKHAEHYYTFISELETNHVYGKPPHLEAFEPYTIKDLKDYLEITNPENFIEELFWDTKQLSSGIWHELNKTWKKYERQTRDCRK